MNQPTLQNAGRLHIGGKTRDHHMTVFIFAHSDGDWSFETKYADGCFVEAKVEDAVAGKFGDEIETLLSQYRAGANPETNEITVTSIYKR